MKKFKKSRNVLATTVLLGALLSGGQALAEDSHSSATEEVSVETNEDAEVVEGPVNVDGFWYKFDRLLQNLQITFTTDDEKKVKLLMSVAKERLEEASYLSDKEQIELLDSIMVDYLKKLQEAGELVGEIIFVGDLVDEEKEELVGELEELTDVVKEIKENLSDELTEELEETVERVTIVANVVKGIDPEIVTSLREQNLGYGQIAQVVALAEVSGKSVEELTTYFTGEKKQGFGKVVKELGYHPGEIATQVKETRLMAELEEANATGDNKKIAKIEKKLAKIEDRKAKFENKRRNDKSNEEKNIDEQEDKNESDNTEEPEAESNDEGIVVPKKEETKQEQPKQSQEKRQDQVNKQDEKVEKKAEKQREQAEKRQEKQQEQAQKKQEKQQEKAEKHAENSKGQGNQEDN